MNNLINANEYLKTTEEYESLTKLMTIFEKNIKPDGVRNRAYLKLVWNRKLAQISLAQNQDYFQTAKANIADGGKVRTFATMDAKILELTIIKNIIASNLKIISEFLPLKNQQELILGLHFVQYKATKYGASYSSPDVLHIDDEPLVFVHLLNLTENALGGDNLIADIKTKEITNCVRLENPLETMVLTHDFYHAVTPLGSRGGEAKREILLFTVEPSTTQIKA